MISLLINLYRNIKNKVILFSSNLISPNYRLEEIDLTNERVVLYCCGSKAFLKITIEEIILNATIIDDIHSVQACWLGYYHGKSLREGKRKQPLSPGHFLLRPSLKKYNIVGLDHRDLKIIYLDNKFRVRHSKLVTSLAQDNDFLENISPSQACYIGIWAGIAVGKHGTVILKNDHQEIPNYYEYLRLVK